MPSIKDWNNQRKWNSRVNKVDSAVKTLESFKLGYSVTKGVTGNYSNFSKKQLKKITAAADTMGKFQAGYYPRPNNRGQNSSNIDVSPAHFEPINLSEYDLVQEKSLKQSKNSMHLRAAQQFISRINYDYRHQMHPNRRILGLTPEDAQEWSALTESLWRQDKKLKDWSEDLKNNYNQLTNLAMNMYLNIGEFFAVNRSYIDDPEHRTNLSIDLYHPMQIQSPRLAYGNIPYSIRYSNCGVIVETSCREYYNNLEKKGNYIEKGIEYNSKNQEIAIFIAPVKWGQPYVRVPFKNKNGFTQVLHGYIQREPGQKRGMPDSAYAWHEFMNIRDLARFEMQSARLNSTISGTVTADSNAQPGGQQGGMNEIGQPAGWGSIDSSETGLADYEDPGYSVREVDGGGYIVQNFTPGYKYTEHKTDRPNVNIPVFIEKNLEYTHPGTYGLSTTLVSQKLEGSYNASKGKIDISWKTGIEFYLKQFSSDWDDLLYPLWLNGKVATGQISCPGFDDINKKTAWCSMSVITPAKPSLNPLAEAKAGKERISYGASTMEHEAQIQTGTSAEENLERLKFENVKVKEAFPEEQEQENTTLEGVM